MSKMRFCVFKNVEFVLEPLRNEAAPSTTRVQAATSYTTSCLFSNFPEVPAKEPVCTKAHQTGN